MTIIMEAQVAADGMASAVARMNIVPILLVGVGGLSIGDDVVGHALVRRPGPTVVGIGLVSMDTGVCKVVSIRVCRKYVGISTARKSWEFVIGLRQRDVALNVRG